ncbi:hypothetical protein [Streptomyces xanthochromogenes]|uniref:Leucine rich repeat variant n=1 Tax=Streptomyces xanthochromogenes TaxID=67384 RepID=A0ABQ2ZKP4_9ACTN|nr:hypothetical protein [Streptomyces xanthochromogenes]GGY16614.1 hypothetical protein GCM10010326_05820 [Streptomyces xanthochromogenes]
MDHALHGLAANPSLPPDLVDRLISVADTDLADELADRADLTHDQATTLATHIESSAQRLAQHGMLTAADVDPATRPAAALALLGEGSGPAAWARLFATDPDVTRRERLAGCPGLPRDVVETLAADPDTRVVAELAFGATPEVAAALAAHPRTEVRRAVAANEATPPTVLAGLLTGEGIPHVQRCPVCEREETPFLHDPECPRPDCDLPAGASCDGFHESAAHGIQQAALHNPATPASAAAGFAEHPSELLRRAVAARRDLPAEVYGRLALDPAPGVRADLAQNPSIDDAVIEVLAQDRGHDVQRRLAHHPRVPLDVLVRLVGRTRIGPTLLPRIAIASPTEIEELAQSPLATVRMLIARRRDLPAPIRDALTTDPDAAVVTSIASHPGLSEARLRAMVDRHGVRVMAGVAANPDATGQLLEELSRRRPQARKALREIARHRNATARALLACLSDEKARRTAAGHPALPAQAFAELLGDGDWQVVEAAAANPSLPAAVMAQLLPRT